MRPEPTSTRAGRRLAELRSATDRISGISGTASSADGSVTVVVASDGTLLDLQLTPAARSTPPDELARQIRDAYERARGAAWSEAAQVLATQPARSSGSDPADPQVDLAAAMRAMGLGAVLDRFGDVIGRPADDSSR